VRLLWQEGQSLFPSWSWAELPGPRRRDDLACFRQEVVGMTTRASVLESIGIASTSERARGRSMPPPHHESRSGRYRQLRQQPVISSLILVPASNGSLNKRTSLAELVGCRRPVAAMCLRAREAPQTRPRNSQLEDRWRPSPLQPWREQDRLGLSLPRGRADCPIR
jgi:hypothetical protein